MKTRILSIILLLGLTFLEAQESEVLTTGPYDTGRLRTNTQIDFHGFNQWNGDTDAPGNVGWGEAGLWWSFARFGSDAATHPNPDLFNKLSTADVVNLKIGVLWNEVDGNLAGIVDPGVVVGVYLIPGFHIPDGSYPTFPNAWPFEYATQIKLFEFAPGTVPVASLSWDDFQLNAPTDQDRLDNLVTYDITDAINTAILAGQLTDITPWGIVFMNEEALPELTPNNPEWADKRGTVLDGKYIQLEVVTGVETATWAGFEIDANGNVETGGWLGTVYVTEAPWVYVYDLSSYVYMPESALSETGSWGYVPQ